MVETKDFETKVGYCLGVASIVFAFILPIAGIVSGILGLVTIKSKNMELSKIARRLNITGLVLSILLFIISIIATAYFTINGIGGLGNLPLA